MKVSTSSRSALCASIAAALLAACGGSQPPIGAPGAMPQGHVVTTQATHGGSWIAPDYKVSRPLLYATNLGYQDVTVYRATAKDPAPLATISDGLNIPVGACIDGQGTLYVTNEPASGGWVSEYPLGKTKPSSV